MRYQVTIQRKTAKGLKKLPVDVKKLLFLLIEDLKADGSFQTSWPNPDKLDKNLHEIIFCLKISENYF